MFAYIPHGLKEEAQRLGWLWSARLPSPHGAYADLWVFPCNCGRPAIHPRSGRTETP